MNIDLIEYIKHYLKRYDEIIEELDENFDKIEKLGRYQAMAPYGYKYKISILIEYLEKKGDDIQLLKEKYENINKKLIEFEKKRGRTYYNKVYEDLKYSVDTYYVTICHFLELDPIDMETENDLLGRDYIEIILNELKEVYNIHDMKIKVYALDEALKCKFKRNLKIIMEECPDIEQVYYPEHFWWRHPSEFKR